MNSTLNPQALRFLQHACSVLQHYDRDGNGFVPSHEWPLVLQQLGVQDVSDEAVLIMEHLARADDGYFSYAPLLQALRGPDQARDFDWRDSRGAAYDGRDLVGREDPRSGGYACQELARDFDGRDPRSGGYGVYGGPEMARDFDRRDRSDAGGYAGQDYGMDFDGPNPRGAGGQAGQEMGRDLFGRDARGGGCHDSQEVGRDFDRSDPRGGGHAFPEPGRDFDPRDARGGGYHDSQEVRRDFDGSDPRSGGAYAGQEMGRDFDRRDPRGVGGHSGQFFGRDSDGRERRQVPSAPMSPSQGGPPEDEEAFWARRGATIQSLYQQWDCNLLSNESFMVQLQQLLGDTVDVASPDSEFVRLTNKHRSARNMKYSSLMSALRQDQRRTARSHGGSVCGGRGPSGSMNYAASEMCQSEYGDTASAAGRPTGVVAQLGAGRKHFNSDSFAHEVDRRYLDHAQPPWVPEPEPDIYSHSLGQPPPVDPSMQSAMTDPNFWSQTGPRPAPQAKYRHDSMSVASEMMSEADTQREAFHARNRTGHGNILTWGDPQPVTPRRGRQQTIDENGIPKSYGQSSFQR